MLQNTLVILTLIAIVLSLYYIIPPCTQWERITIAGTLAIGDRCVARGRP